MVAKRAGDKAADAEPCAYLLDHCHNVSVHNYEANAT